MPYNPKSAENLLKLEPLPDGIKSGVTRIRARAEAFAWWGSLTAAERGQMVEQLYVNKPDVTPDTPQGGGADGGRAQTVKSDKTKSDVTDDKIPRMPSMAALLMATQTPPQSEPAEPRPLAAKPSKSKSDVTSDKPGRRKRSEQPD